MNDVLDLPAERDLPAVRAAKMRAELIGVIDRPRPPTARSRIAVITSAAFAVAAVVAVVGVPVLPGPRHDDGTQLLAMGPNELDPKLRRAAEQCLTWNDQHERLPVTMDDLAVAAQSGNTAAMLFLTKSGYFTCSARSEIGGIGGASDGADQWPQRDWLPGPVQRLLLTSTESESGDVTVSGRISARVHRLVLEHGDGQWTQARLAAGVFGLVTSDADVNKNAELVSYDADGKEIDRRPLWQAEDQLDHCYVDPSGTVIYVGRAGMARSPEPAPTASCLPAEPWTR